MFDKLLFTADGTAIPLPAVASVHVRLDDDRVPDTQVVEVRVLSGESHRVLMRELRRVYPARRGRK